MHTGVYGYRKLTLDMRDLGERCSKHRVAKLLKQEGLQAQRGYRRRSGSRGGQPAVVAPNVLEQQFSVEMPNEAWVHNPSVTHLAQRAPEFRVHTVAGSADHHVRMALS